VADGPRLRDPTIPFGLALAGAMGVLRLRPLGAPDTWWHLSIGRTVLDEGARRFPDRVGIPPKDEFVAGEWVFDVLAVGLWDLGGSAALVTFAALCASASALLVWALARAVAGPDGRWAALGVTALVVGVTTVRFFPRPHVLFLVLLPAVLVVAWRAARAPAGEQLRWLAGLLVLVAIWSQCHPSAVIAPAVVAGAGFPAVLGRRHPGERHGLTPALWVALVAVCLLPLLSPYGLGLSEQVLGHSGTDSTAHIGEMHPMPVEWWWPPHARSILLVEALAALGIVASVAGRRLALGPAALALFGLLMTLNTHRFRAAWSILMVPWLLDGLRAWRPPPRVVRVLVVATVIAIPAWEATRWDGPDLGLDPAWVPTDLGDAADRFALSGPIFNDYDAGGYLGFRRYGDVRVFIDGRTPPFFTDDHFWAARAALAEPSVFDRLHSEYAFTAAVVPSDATLCRALVAQPAWTPVWRGPRRTMFLPSGDAIADPCGQAK